jgi:drug/metabolite transporter (DMT)-like permease
MDRKKQTTLAIFMFILVLLINSVIFSIVPALSSPDLAPIRATYSSMLGFAPSTQTLSAFQILFCYSVIATACMLPWAFKQGRAGLSTTRWKHYSLRAVLEYTAYSLTLISLGYLGTNFTLPMHTALNFITPLLATVIAIIALKEKSGAHTWIALIVGFVGVLVITRPGMIPASPGVLYVLGAALGFSSCGVVIKLLCSTESPRKIAFYLLLMTTVLSAPMGLLNWQAPDAEAWFWLAVIGVLSYAVQILVGAAISKVPYMVIIPLNFVQLIFSTVLSYLVYAKPTDLWTYTGAVIILAGTIYNTYRNRVHAEREAAMASAM